MFTGIVQYIGRVAGLTPRGEGVELTIDRGGWSPRHSGEPELGDSICVSGACLTVTRVEGSVLAFDVVQETLDRTKLGRLGVGDSVNLEPSVTPSQPMGGHFMQGHVDGLGMVAAISQNDHAWRTTIRPPAELLPMIIQKGSIAVDGVSLTIASVGCGGEGTFDIALIPTTLGLTTLATLTAGDVVNLEADILSKTVVHNLTRQVVGDRGDQPVSMALLREAGFA